MVATMQYFALATGAAGFAAAAAALPTAAAAHLGYTPSLLQRVSVKAGVVVVGAFVEEADLTGDLASLAQASVPNALCLDRYIDDQDLSERGFAMVGEMGRTPYPLFSGVRYICPLGVNTSGVEDGLTPWTGFNSPRSLAINGGASRFLQGGFRYILCRGVAHNVSAVYSTSIGRIEFTNASATQPIVLGCDHPFLPAVVVQAFSDGDASVKQAAWVSEGGGIYSQEDWRRADGVGNNPAQFVPFQSSLVVTSEVDPAASYRDILEAAWWHQGTSETTLAQKQWFLVGRKMYVRLPGDAAPGADFNICNRWDGLPTYYIGVGSSAGARNIILNNFRQIGLGQSTSQIRGCDSLTVQGGQLAMSPSGADSGYFLGTTATMWRFRAAEWGRLNYDRSDIKDRDGITYGPSHPIVQELIATKGSAAAAWADFDLWAHLVGCSNGPGWNNNSSANKDLISGLIVEDVNVIISNTGGTLLTYSHVDGHGLSSRNGSLDGTTRERFLLLRGGRHIDDYVSATGDGNAPYTGSGANWRNNITQDFIVDDDNGRSIGKGHCGIGPEGDNDAVVYRDGTGLKDGNIFRRFCIRNLDNPSYTSQAISSSNEQAHSCEDYIVENCLLHYSIGRNFQCSVAWASLHTSGGTVETEVTPNLLSTGNVATPLTLAVPGDYFMVGQIGPFGRVELNLQTAGVGSAVVAVEELTGSGWVAVAGLQDFTNGLTTSGLHGCNWTKNVGMVAAGAGGAVGLHVMRWRLVSGSFSVTPVAIQLRGRRISGALRSRGATVRQTPSWNLIQTTLWRTDQDGINIMSSGYEDVDEFDYFLPPGVAQDALVFNENFTDYAFWKTAAASFFEKHLFATSEAPQDANHGDNTTLANIHTT